MLFDTFATTVWKPSCAKLRECTKVGYESALNCHILPQWSGRDMDAITVADIESWLDSFANPNGTIRCANMGDAGSNQVCVGSLCYPIS